MGYKKCKWCGNQFDDKTMFGTEKYCGNKCKSEAESGGGSGSGGSNYVVDAKTNKYDTQLEKERQKGEIALEKERANSEIKKEVVSSGLSFVKDSISDSKQKAIEQENAVLSLDLGDDFETIIKNLDGLLTAYRAKSANQGLLSGGKAINIYEAKIREGVKKLERLDGDNPKVQKEIAYYQNEIGNQTLNVGANKSKSNKKRLIAFLLCFIPPFGFVGAHRFYTGRILSAVFMIITLGGFGVWTLIDLIMILSGSFKDKDGNVIKQWT
jgi:TM2 domain-containing membrane protein YozV